MLDLAAASILARELSSAQYEAPPASRRGRSATEPYRPHGKFAAKASSGV